MVSTMVQALPSLISAIEAERSDTKLPGHEEEEASVVLPLGMSVDRFERVDAGVDADIGV
jgi:hypothetical protein